MTSEPLQAFSPPDSLSALLPGGVSAGLAAQWLVYAVFFFWAAYTVVAVYHWLRYSHASLVAIPAIAVHLFVSIALIAFALSGALTV